MTRATGYSLWLMPSGRIYDQLQNLITHLSREYHTPAFPPHITLLGEMAGSEEEIVSTTSLVADRITPFAVRLTEIVHTDAYFRALFIRAEKTPALIATNREARRAFGLPPDPDFLPHLSLLYGHLPAETKEKINGARGHDYPASFAVRHIHLFSTTGKPTDWHSVRAFPLHR